jgi:uncharacterized membrane protein
MSLYWISVSLHVLAALFWLGGMFFLALVGAPLLRKVEPASLRAELFRDLGARFRLAGWIAIAVLLTTGLLNLQLRGLLIIVVVSLFLSFAIEPAVTRLQQRGVRRGLGTWLVFLLVLVLFTGFIAAMTGLELHRAAGEPKEMHAYDADHAVRDPQAAVDRASFLGRHLGWADG